MTPAQALTDRRFYMKGGAVEINGRIFLYRVKNNLLYLSAESVTANSDGAFNSYGTFSSTLSGNRVRYMFAGDMLWHLYGNDVLQNRHQSFLKGFVATLLDDDRVRFRFLANNQVRRLVINYWLAFVILEKACTNDQQKANLQEALYNRIDHTFQSVYQDGSWVREMLDDYSYLMDDSDYDESSDELIANASMVPYAPSSEMSDTEENYSSFLSLTARMLVHNGASESISYLTLKTLIEALMTLQAAGGELWQRANMPSYANVRDSNLLRELSIVGTRVAGVVSNTATVEAAPFNPYWTIGSGTVRNNPF